MLGLPNSYAFLFLLSIPILVRYIVIYVSYHFVNTRRWTGAPRTQAWVPPDLPPSVPVLGLLYRIFFDGAAFVKRVTTYCGHLTCIRVSLLPTAPGIFVIQDPEAVAAMWKHPALASPVYMYTVGLRRLFGMKESAITTYTADDSGPYRKPHPKSNIAPHNRIDFLTHDSLLRGLTGPGLAPMFQRFQAVLAREVNNLKTSKDWTEMPDMLRFFKDHLGRAILTSLVGPSLLETHPTFLSNLWAFDAAVPYIIRGTPRLFSPSGYSARDTLLRQLQTWYKHARAQAADPSPANPDTDPVWGTALMRERQQFLLKADKQDDAALASADLGLLWTALLARVRASLADTVSGSVCPAPTSELSVDVDIDMDRLLRNDLLQSIYAETLRLHVQSYVTRCSPHEPVVLGRWVLPANEVATVSSYAAQMSEEVWDARPGGGAHPVTEFWADRFLLDSPAGEGFKGLKHDSRTGGGHPAEQKTGRFSMKGLEGSWVPYGAGFGACPGRHFAKRIMLYTIALFVTRFDVDVRTTTFRMDSLGFGLGTEKPKDKVAFALRRREGIGMGNELGA
ncbi:cytochrome P450 [Aspergillus multicolor]|uniref:cytochrome P450 n=1 Tax=Aspergillus multicolor TaxID=41759 RepID=UPI003CCE15E5